MYENVATNYRGYTTYMEYYTLLIPILIPIKALYDDYGSIPKRRIQKTLRRCEQPGLALDRSRVTFSGWWPRDQQPPQSLRFPLGNLRSNHRCFFWISSPHKIHTTWCAQLDRLHCGTLWGVLARALRSSIVRRKKKKKKTFVLLLVSVNSPFQVWFIFASA